LRPHAGALHERALVRGRLALEARELPTVGLDHPIPLLGEAQPVVRGGDGGLAGRDRPVEPETVDAQPVPLHRPPGELLIEVAEPFRLRATGRRAAAEIGGEIERVLRGRAVALDAEGLAHGLEPLLRLRGQDLAHLLLGHVDGPPPEVRVGLGVRIVRKAEQLDHALAQLGRRVLGLRSVDGEADLLRLERLLALAAQAPEPPEDRVAVPLALELDRHLGVRGAVADEVRRLDLRAPEERHLDRVEEARLAGAHVADEQGGAGGEVDVRRLVAADVLDRQASKLHRAPRPYGALSERTPKRRRALPSRAAA